MAKVVSTAHSPVEITSFDFQPAPARTAKAIAAVPLPTCKGFIMKLILAALAAVVSAAAVAAGAPSLTPHDELRWTEINPAP